MKDIQIQYEKIIPDIVRDNIVKTGIVLKTEMVILFDEMDNKLPNQQYLPFTYKIQNLIEDWFRSRFKELLIEYKKLDQKTIEIQMYQIDATRGPLLRFGKNFPHYNECAISYKDIVLRPSELKKYKDEVYSLEAMSEAKKIISHNSVSEFKEFINSLQDPFTREWKDYVLEMTCLDNFDDIRRIIDNVYTKGLNNINDSFSDYNECLNIIIKCEEYYRKKLFRFTDFDPQLMKTRETIDNQDHINKLRLPENFRQSLYNIMETVDQFTRIYRNYVEMILSHPPILSKNIIRVKYDNI